MLTQPLTQAHDLMGNSLAFPHSRDAAQPHRARRGTRTPISIGACLAFLIVFFFSSLRCRALFCLLWSPFYCLFLYVPRTKRSGGRGEAQTEQGFHVLTLTPVRARFVHALRLCLCLRYLRSVNTQSIPPVWLANGPLTSRVSPGRGLLRCLALLGGNVLCC
ncbi:hypothetical protein B0H13DRAFT_1992586 [Mycena leptocephala]|nr:hypothetical protein B0H13DRAFT_1992586 [Mycena leptocephala]